MDEFAMTCLGQLARFYKTIWSLLPCMLSLKGPSEELPLQSNQMVSAAL